MQVDILIPFLTNSEGAVIRQEQFDPQAVSASTARYSVDASID